MKRRSFDPRDICRKSPRWPHHERVNGKEDDKESISGDCVSKSTKKNDHILTTDDSLVGRQCETESKRSSSPMLSPTFLSDPSKICMEVATIKSNDPDDLDRASN